MGKSADIYVSQNGAGDGTAAFNSKSIAWLNSNWASISAGDTIHLVGTLTTRLVVSKSGISGNPITLLFETNAMFEAAVWPIAGAISASGKSNIVIDGGVNGLIRNTDNGTLLGNQADSIGIRGDHLLNFVVKNLTITNMYKHIRGRGDWLRHGECVDITGSSLTVQSCHFGDGDTLLSITTEPDGTSTNWATSRDWNVKQNDFTRFNHGFNFGTAAPYTIIDGVLIESNRMDYLSAWDETGSTQLHLDAIIFIAEGKVSGTNSPAFYSSNVVIRANYIGPNVGTNNTSGIFCDTYFANACTKWSIYNNLFTYNSKWNNGCLNILGTDVLIANNTFIGVAGSTPNNGTGIAIKLGSGCTIINNVFSLNGTVLAGQDNGRPDFIDYNVYDQFDNTDSGVFIGSAPGNMRHNIVSWVTYCHSFGSESNTVAVFPLRSIAVVNYLPTSEAANGFSPFSMTAFQGKNLTALGITNDYYGNLRPATGSWIIGAFQMAGTFKKLLPPPTNMAAGPGPVTP